MRTEQVLDMEMEMRTELVSVYMLDMLLDMRTV